MRIRVFGGLTEQVGGDHIEVAVPEDGSMTVSELRATVASAYPHLAPLLQRVTVAVDLEVARNDEFVPSDAEVALLPPVAGGAGADHLGRVTVTGLVQPPIDVEGTLVRLSDPAVGATVVFLGTVRDHAPGVAGVVQLRYSAYEPMAERQLGLIAEQMLADHPEVTGIAALHALGDLEVGAHTVLIAAASAHRSAAFDACRATLEAVKDRVPVFKQEVTTDGTTRWVGLEPPSQTDAAAIVEDEG